MKVVIAGSREVTDFELLENVVERSGYQIVSIISGCARGVDTLGIQWASKYNKNVVRMPADWNKHSKAAGHIRNAEMAEVADAAIIIWDGKSSGTRNMIENMKRLRKPYYLWMTE